MMQGRLDKIPEGREKQAISDQLVTFDGIDVFFNQVTERRLHGVPMTALAPTITGDKVLQMRVIFQEMGLEKSTTCGDATLLLYDVRAFVDSMEKLASDEPERWFAPEEAAWMRKADSMAAK